MSTKVNIAAVAAAMAVLVTPMLTSATSAAKCRGVRRHLRSHSRARLRSYPLMAAVCLEPTPVWPCVSNSGATMAGVAETEIR